VPSPAPPWRGFQRSAGHDDFVARFLVSTRGNYDIRAALKEALDGAYEALDWDEPEEADVGRMIAIDWSCTLQPDDGSGDSELPLPYALYRIGLRPDNAGWDDLGRDALEDARAVGTPSRGDGLVASFADALLGLPRAAVRSPGIDHILRLHDPQRLSHYADLGREIAAIEMAVRECLSVIFLGVYPDRPHNFLEHTKISTTPKEERPTTEDLIERQENQLFHILFNEYAYLNEPIEAKIVSLVRQIREADSFEALKELVSALPIGDDRDSGFIAALKTLMDPIERVRNPVCHSRAIPHRAWQNYENARERIWERIAQFWADRADGT
jgi:hypothetical protein